MTGRFVNTEAARESGENIGFSFGENWVKYLNELSEKELDQAVQSLEHAFANEGLKGHRFLDLGSGSGLFSLAAHTLGVRSIASIDIDPHSVACTAFLRNRVGDPPAWSIARGSVLDPAFLATFDPVDRLYCWGVLHHTGAMWSAFDAALGLIAPGGLGCIALYNRPRHLKLHLALKRTYNHLPRVIRPVMVGLCALAYFLRLLTTGRNPIKFVRDYGALNRGMSFWRALEDWLGGLPYEFAEADEVEARVRERGLRIVRSVVRAPGNNNDYLIARSRARESAGLPDQMQRGAVLQSPTVRPGTT